MNSFLLLSLLVSTIFFVASTEGDENKHIICYYGTWATYRPGNGKFAVEDIDPNLCTHLMYSFVGIDDEGNIIALDPALDLPDNNGANKFAKFNALKERYPNLKTLLAVGGWNEGSAKYSVMAADANLRKNFINSARDLILTYGYDGFDLDWEYPNRRDTIHGEEDIDNFTQLIIEMKEEFNKYGLILTAAVAAVGEMAEQSYDIPAICEHLDMVGLMTYDMYGAWDPVTGHNAPLHKGEGDEDIPRESLYTVDVAVEYWLAKGCSPEKLVVGIPFYGRSFTLSDENINGLRAPSAGAGIAGPYTGEGGYLGYNEICEIFLAEDWNIRYDALAKVPYAVQGHNWLSFDNADSIAEKINWALQRNVSGIMIWSIETDDFHGFCGEVNALLKTVNVAIDSFEYKDMPDSSYSFRTRTSVLLGLVNMVVMYLNFNYRFV